MNEPLRVPLIGKYEGEFLLFDPDVPDWITRLRWYGCRGQRSKTLYGRTYLEGGKVAVSAHYFIIGVPPAGLVTDHKNMNGLDNRRENLHHVTQQENNILATPFRSHPVRRKPKKRGGVRTTIKYLADGSPRTYFYDSETGERLLESEALKRFGKDLPERTKAGLQNSK
ncbi:MAG: HNH endonuclease [Pseudomonadota bacterium]